MMVVDMWEYLNALCIFCFAFTRPVGTAVTGWCEKVTWGLLFLSFFPGLLAALSLLLLSIYSSTFSFVFPIAAVFSFLQFLALICFDVTTCVYVTYESGLYAHIMLKIVYGNCRMYVCIQNMRKCNIITRKFLVVYKIW